MSTPARCGTATRGVGATLRVPGQPDLRLPALLRCAAADPHAVRLVLLLDAEDESPGSVEWTFGRSLLNAGLTAPVGERDVRVQLVGRSVVVELAGEASVLLPLDGLVAFLAQADDLVPAGAQEPAVAALVDAELARLLG